VRHTIRAVAGSIALTCVVALAGGSTGANPVPEPSVDTAEASPTPDRPSVLAVESGPVVVVVTVRGTAMRNPHVSVVTGDDDTATALTFDLSDLPKRPVNIELEPPGSMVLNADGSVTVLDEAGTAVGGFTVPVGGALFEQVGPAHVRLASVNESLPPPAEVRTFLGTKAVAGTDWGDREGGRSLAVEPTDWARGAGQAGWTTAWAELVEAEPEVDSPGVYEQLICHAIGARDKATWNLEPWRPHVGLANVVSARCNPTS
jgi:hypothetical protein